MMVAIVVIKEDFIGKEKTQTTDAKEIQTFVIAKVRFSGLGVFNKKLSQSEAKQ